MCIDCPDLIRRDTLKFLVSAVAVGIPVAARGADAKTYGESVEIAYAGDVTSGRLFRAQSRGRPAIVVAHGNPGFDADYSEFCEALSANDFNVLALDWTTGSPPYPADASARGEWIKNTVGSATFWERGARRYSSAIEWLERERINIHGKSFALGICGGGIVLGNLAALGAPLEGLVLYHAAARLKSERNASTPALDLIDLAPQIKCEVQGHYGMLDQVALVSDANEFEGKLNASGRRARFHYYADAGHGFVLSGSPYDKTNHFGYVASASRKAVKRSIRFFEAS